MDGEDVDAGLAGRIGVGARTAARHHGGAAGRIVRPVGVLRPHGGAGRQVRYLRQRAAVLQRPLTHVAGEDAPAPPKDLVFEAGEQVLPRAARRRAGQHVVVLEGAVQSQRVRLPVGRHLVRERALVAALLHVEVVPRVAGPVAVPGLVADGAVGAHVGGRRVQAVVDGGVVLHGRAGHVHEDRYPQPLQQVLLPIPFVIIGFNLWVQVIPDGQDPFRFTLPALHFLLLPLIIF